MKNPAIILVLSNKPVNQKKIEIANNLIIEAEKQFALSKKHLHICTQFLYQAVVVLNGSV